MESSEQPRGATGLWFLRTCWVGLMMTIYMLMVLTYHQRHLRRLRRSLSLVVLILALSLLINPGASLSDNEETSERSVVTSTYRQWTPYLFLVSTGAAAIAITSGLFLPRSLFSLLVGGPFGLALSLAYLPYPPPTLPTFVLLMITTSTIVILTYVQPNFVMHPVWYTLFMPAVVVFLLSGIFPAIYSYFVPVMKWSRDSKQTLEEAEILLSATHAAASAFLAIAVKAGANNIGKSKKKGSEKKIGVKRDVKIESGAVMAYQAIGNICCFVCILGGWRLIQVLHEDYLIGLLLTPILLLLNKDHFLLGRLNSNNQWAPIIGAATLYLSFHLVSEIASSVFEWHRPRDYGFIFKTSLLLLPALWSLCSLCRFLWNPRAPTDSGLNTLLLIAPLNILPVLTGDTPTLQLLGLCAIAGVMLEVFQSWQLQNAEDKFL